MTFHILCRTSYNLSSPTWYILFIYFLVPDLGQQRCYCYSETNSRGHGRRVLNNHGHKFWICVSSVPTRTPPFKGIRSGKHCIHLLCCRRSVSQVSVCLFSNQRYFITWSTVYVYILQVLGLWPLWPSRRVIIIIILWFFRSNESTYKEFGMRVGGR